MSDETSHPRNLFGCAIFPNIVENAAELPSAQPFPHDVSTNRLHNPTHCQGLNPSDRWGNRDAALLFAGRFDITGKGTFTMHVRTTCIG